MSHLKDIEDQISLFPPDVAANVTIIRAKDLPIPYSIRIDEKLPIAFVPRMPASAASLEKKTVPRVISAPTLIGCLTGHGHAIWLVTSRKLGEPGNNFYKISGFEFEYALKPTKKLVYDAEDSGELWHTTYNKETINYPHFNAGEMFIHKVSTIVVGDAKVNKVEVEFLVKVLDNRGFLLTENKKLERGHYLIKGDFSRYATNSSKEAPKRLSYKDDHLFNVTEIKAEVYKSFRDISVTKKG